MPYRYFFRKLWFNLRMLLTYQSGYICSMRRKLMVFHDRYSFAVSCINDRNPRWLVSYEPDQKLLEPAHKQSAHR